MSARQAALEALMRCRRDGAWSGAAMDSVVKKYGLDRREAAFASRLCLSVLENSALCDFYIGSFCTSKLEPTVRDVLRLGVCQLLFFDRVPARAAVDESVALCRAAGCTRAAGLVNAVLRRIADARGDLPVIPGEGTPEYLSILYSHPLWLAELLCERKGYAFTEAFFAANNRPAPLTIQVNTLKIEAADYIRALQRAELSFEACPDLPGCLTLAAAAPQELPGYEEGLFYVQDRAARLAVEAAAPEAGMRVLDACASPGGKSFAAALRMKNQGEILACDIHEKKLRLVTEGVKRLGISIVETRAADAREYAPELAESFDLVIADVPCSGLGVIRKKPEIRSKKWESITKLPQIQADITDNLSNYLKKDGVFLYSTCTVLEEENERVVEDFLKQYPAFVPEEFSIGELKSENGMVTFWPNITGTDGFFVAKLRKR
ncbi:MAG: 16S rRNA (cytosine(967)-C(5))-methyltransferase RsmB [Oscillospiraceae bacterium]|nr:16S rRNA (cytosine(967)-C(5))-methyltransferase RsmB [Oscillospiraceae bacterium]